MIPRVGLGVTVALLLTQGGSAEDLEQFASLREPHLPFIQSALLPGPRVFAASLPEHPLEVAPGSVLTRVLFATPGVPSTRVHVHDVQVPPDNRGEVAALPGPAVVDVLQGQGTLSVGGQNLPLADGTMQLIAANQSLTIINANSRPLLLRLYLFEASCPEPRRNGGNYA
jgi:hypothetical protein